MAHLRRRGKRRNPRFPDLTVSQILAWADEHKALYGSWPTRFTREKVLGMGEENWHRLDKCLREGRRGLPAGSSLLRLLHEERGVRHQHLQPRLTRGQVLAWTDAHFARHGDWPQQEGGSIDDAPEETWMNVDAALRYGLRGLPGGSSLAQLLQKHRGVRNSADVPPLTLDKIVTWARRHRGEHGEWPTRTSGSIPGQPDETWSAVDCALHRGGRSLPGQSSLALLLAERFGVYSQAVAPALSIEQVLAWADAHHRRTGEWPRRNSGDVVDAPNETWGALNKALRHGHRGLPGGMSLAELLVKHRGVPNAWHQEPLSVAQIVEWAEDYQKRHGKWPTRGSGPIAGAPAGETWQQVSAWLAKGRRGLPKGSLAQLLKRRA
jgi:hypothetical protein